MRVWLLYKEIFTNSFCHVFVSEKRIIDMEYHLPFLCFSVDDILLLLSCMLTQQRIIFLGSDYSLLTPVMEVCKLSMAGVI